MTFKRSIIDLNTVLNPSSLEGNQLAIYKLDLKYTGTLNALMQLLYSLMSQIATIPPMNKSNNTVPKSLTTNLDTAKNTTNMLPKNNVCGMMEFS